MSKNKNILQKEYKKKYRKNIAKKILQKNIAKKILQKKYCKKKNKKMFSLSCKSM